MDGAALIPMDMPGCGVWKPTNGRLTARGGGEGETGWSASVWEQSRTGLGRLSG